MQSLFLSYNLASVWSPIIWLGPFYGHLLYLALPEYSAIPVFLHMRSHAKIT